MDEFAIKFGVSVACGWRQRGVVARVATLVVRGLNEPPNLKYINIYIYIYFFFFLLLYFTLKNIFTYIDWNPAHSNHRSIQPKTKQQLDI